MEFKCLVTILICDLIFAAIAAPLILRKVPRNGLYGFRTPATLRDDRVWYEANAYFGKAFLCSSAVSALLMVWLYYSGTFSGGDFLTATKVVLAAPPLAAVLLTFLRIRSLT